MPDPIRIRSGSAGKHWPEAGRMILAHLLASGPDPFCQNLTQSARTKSDPGWFCTVLSGTDVDEQDVDEQDVDEQDVDEQDRAWKSETGSGPVASC